ALPRGLAPLCAQPAGGCPQPPATIHNAAYRRARVAGIRSRIDTDRFHECPARADPMAGPRGATSPRLAAVASEQRSKVRGHELPRKLELGEGGAATGALLFGH